LPCILSQEYHEKNWFLQHTYPALEKVIEHLHLAALNKFRSDLDQALSSGEGFTASVHQCVQASMAEFDAGLRGICEA